MRERDRLIELLLERSVRHGEFLLSSGHRSNYYIDARLTTMSAEGLHLVGGLGLAAIRGMGWHPSAVGGLTLGADPVAYAIAMASTSTPPLISAFTVRKEPKGHGTGSQVEGNLRPGDPVVVVEDVITSGRSASRAIRVVREAGARVLGVLGVVDRQEGGKERLESEGHTIVVVLTTTELGLAPPR